MKHISRNVFLVLLLLSVFGSFYANDTLSFFRADELICQAAAREMMQFHDYLVPRLHNEYLLNKPPLYYWLLAGSFSVFGDNPFAARFPAAVMGVLTVMMVYTAATKLWNERIGFWAGMILSSSLLFFYTGKVSAANTTCSFFLAGTLLCFMYEKYWLQYIFGGLAVLASGLAGLLFPAGIVMLFLLITGKMSRLGRMHVLPGIVLSCAFFVPWYYFVCEIHGMGALFTGFGYESLFCIGKAGSGTGNPVAWWYYILILLAGAFPWTGLLLKSIKDGICESRTVDLRRNIFLDLWWLLALVLFCLCSYIQAGMLISVFPAVAMLVSWNMERMIREERNRFRSWAFTSVLTYVLASAAIVIACRQLPELVFGSIVLSIVILFLGIAVAISLLVYNDGMLAAWLHVAAGFLTMIIVCSFLLPVIPGCQNDNNAPPVSTKESCIFAEK